MKLNSTFVALFAATSLISFAANANYDNVSKWHKGIDIGQAMRRMAPNAKTLEIMQNPDPSQTMGPVRNFRDMDGPDGQIWYYTTELWTKDEDMGYYTQHILTEYQFDIYDASMQLVGTIRDKMRYEDDEFMVPGPDAGIDLLPRVTQKHFNDDDLYEIVVSVAINTKSPGYNHYRSIVYSIGGERTTEMFYDPVSGGEVEKECDKIICTLPSFINDVLDVSHDGQEELYLTLMHDIYPDLDDVSLDDGELYWQSMCQSRIEFEILGKADHEGKLLDVGTISIPMLQLQGNQESTIPLLTTYNNGKAYIVAPHYKESFFNPFYSPFEDMTVRADNSFVIDLYSVSNDGLSLVHSTEVPMSMVSDEDVLAYYYSVGSLRYNSDIAFDVFSHDELPAYYVTRSSYMISTDDESQFCYYVYDAAGQLLRTIFENAESAYELTTIPGNDPLHMFVSYSDNYYYNFVSLIDGKSESSVAIKGLLYPEDMEGGLLPSIVPSEEPAVLLTNADVVPFADGSYKIAFEVSTPAVDIEGNDMMRVAWFNADGAFDRIDYINMGSGVNYAQCYIDGKVLSPTLVCSDEAHEYMVLVKRSISDSSSESQEEFLIAQPITAASQQGTTLLHLTPCEKGNLSRIGVYPVGNEKKLMVIYYNDNGVITDFYDFPLAAVSADPMVYFTYADETSRSAVLMVRNFTTNTSIAYKAVDECKVNKGDVLRLSLNTKDYDIDINGMTIEPSEGNYTVWNSEPIMNDITYHITATDRSYGMVSVTVAITDPDGVVLTEGSYEGEEIDLSQYTPEDEVFLGNDYKKYTLEVNAKTPKVFISAAPDWWIKESVAGKRESELYECFAASTATGTVHVTTQKINLNAKVAVYVAANNANGASADNVVLRDAHRNVHPLVDGYNILDIDPEYHSPFAVLSYGLTNNDKFSVYHNYRAVSFDENSNSYANIAMADQSVMTVFVKRTPAAKCTVTVDLAPQAASTVVTYDRVKTLAPTATDFQVFSGAEVTITPSVGCGVKINGECAPLIDGKCTVVITADTTIEVSEDAGIDNIDLDGVATYTVVSLDGRVILSKAPVSSLRTLAPGIYIINGITTHIQF